MVCERRSDSPNDPAEGRIELVREGDWLTADGTTLGADNGIGIAAMMALAEDESLPHGPLELLMTVNEEIGGPGEGASGFDASLVSGAILLNLDSEEDGKLTVGSASSTDTSIQVEKPREACAPGAVTLAVSVTGGLGGHSGIDIDHGRANAIKVLGHVLAQALDRRTVPARLAERRQELERHSSRRHRHLLDAAGARVGLPRRPRATAAAIGDAYARNDPDITVTVTPRGRCGGRLDGRRRRRPCSTSSRSSQVARSR